MNWYKRQLKIADSKAWEEVRKNKETILEWLSEGNSRRDIANLFGVSPKSLISILKLPVRSKKAVPSSSISSEEGDEIIRLHIDENLRPVDISKKVNRSATSIIDYLKRKGVYKRLRGNKIMFRPTEEEIKKIDYWYSLPPEGEGRSLMWIAKQLGVNGEHVRRWFHKTGRHVRSFKEQVGTQSTKDDMSLAALLEWEKRGGMEGYLKSMTKENAIKYLYGFVGRIWNANPQQASAVKNKYMEIIENHTFPDEVQQTQPV
jgi:DNA-binding CsgD family transcriptional regulator